MQSCSRRKAAKHGRSPRSMQVMPAQQSASASQLVAFSARDCEPCCAAHCDARPARMDSRGRQARKRPGVPSCAPAGRAALPALAWASAGPSAQPGGHPAHPGPGRSTPCLQPGTSTTGRCGRTLRGGQAHSQRSTAEMGAGPPPARRLLPRQGAACCAAALRGVGTHAGSRPAPGLTHSPAAGGVGRIPQLQSCIVERVPRRHQRPGSSGWSGSRVGGCVGGRGGAECDQALRQVV